jgi:hypothetical protein
MTEKHSIGFKMAGHGGAREGAGRPFGSKNRWTRERIAAATESGELLPHEIILTRARMLFAREMAYREAAEAPDIDPDLQRMYISRADELAQRGGPGCLNRFSASIGGASAGVRLPSGEAGA